MDAKTIIALLVVICIDTKFGVAFIYTMAISSLYGLIIGATSLYEFITK